MMTKVCFIHANPIEEYTIFDDVYYVSCCNSKVSTLVEDMESRFNTLYDFWIFIVMVGKARKIS